MLFKPICKSFQNPSLVLPIRMLHEKERSKEGPLNETCSHHGRSSLRPTKNLPRPFILFFLMYGRDPNGAT
jgi:hypothetical protein